MNHSSIDHQEHNTDLMRNSKYNYQDSFQLQCMFVLWYYKLDDNTLTIIIMQCNLRTHNVTASAQQSRLTWQEVLHVQKCWPSLTSQAPAHESVQHEWMPISAHVLGSVIILNNVCIKLITTVILVCKKIWARHFHVIFPCRAARA